MEKKLIIIRCEVCGKRKIVWGIKAKDIKFICDRCDEIIEYNINLRLKSKIEQPKKED